MGVENNECVIAVTCFQDAVAVVSDFVDTLPKEYQRLFAFIPSLVNDKTTIFMAPCGSKKGWPEDKDAQEVRDKLIDIIASLDYPDGSNPFNWIEVGFGEYGQKVLRGNCRNMYSDADYAV